MGLIWSAARPTIYKKGKQALDPLIYPFSPNQNGSDSGGDAWRAFGIPEDEEKLSIMKEDEASLKGDGSDT